MKNQSGSRTVNVITRIFNVKQWADWDRTKASTLYLANGIKKYLVPQRAKATESFATAVKRLNLSDTELLKRQHGLLRSCLIMLVFAFFMFFYSMYLLYTLKIKAFCLSFVVMMLALTFAFRYHFWYFQMKKRKLGCSFKEWYEQGLRGRN